MSALLINKLMLTAVLAAASFQEPVPAVRLPSFPYPENPPASAAIRGPAPPPLPETPIPPEEVQKLVSDLSSNSYRVRQSATGKLKTAGAAAAVSLTSAAQQGDLEVVTRALHILEAIYASGDEEASFAAENALEVLAKSENRSAAIRAEDLLAEYYYEIREPRIVARIRELGGIVKYSAFMEFSRRHPEVQHPQIGYVMLSSRWEWDERGIELLKGLENLQNLYVIPNTGSKPFTDEVARELQSVHPKLIIHKRGRAYLGISAIPDPQGRGIFVSRVEANTGADGAGIQVQDVILSFNGKPVPEFDELIEQIKLTSPGDKLDVEIMRNVEIEEDNRKKVVQRKITLKVVMGELGRTVRP